VFDRRKNLYMPAMLLPQAETRYEVQFKGEGRKTAKTYVVSALGERPGCFHF
jgi:hypothetical protein